MEKSPDYITLKAEYDKNRAALLEKEQELSQVVQECAELECVYILHEQQVKSEKEEKTKLYNQLMNLKE